MGFIPTCRGAGSSLGVSELADYVREARAQERCFLILAEAGERHIQSTFL